MTSRHLRNGAKTEGEKGMAEKETAGSENDSMQTEAESKRMSRVFRVVFIMLVADLLAFTVILPLLPSLLEFYGHNDKVGLYKVLQDSVQVFRKFAGVPDTPRWNSVLFGGLIGSLFSLLQFLSSPITGAISDVYGRKPVMLFCMAGIAGSYALWAISSNFTVFVLARILGGISKGNISLSTAIVTDVSTPQKRGKGMALIGIAFSVGFVFGPMIGAFFSKMARDGGDGGIFYVIPAVFALVLTVSDILFVHLCLEETLPQEKRVQSISSVMDSAFQLINPVSLFNFASVKNLSKADTQKVRGIGRVYFLYLFIYSGLEFTLPFLTHNRFQYDSMQQGKMFFFIGVLMSLVQGGYVRRVKAGKEKKVVMQGILILIPAFVLMAFSYSTLLMYSSLVFFSFASATAVPCLTTLVSMCGSDSQKGAVIGIFRSLGALARALGPVVASTVYWSLGAEACYCMGGLCLVLPLALLAKVSISAPPEGHERKTS